MFLGLQGTNPHRAPVTVRCSVLHTCVLVRALDAFQRWLTGLCCAHVTGGGGRWAFPKGLSTQSLKSVGMW